jgi:IS5 family transposase
LYADAAIACALVVKVVFHLSLRATQGFLESVVRLMGVELPVPDYTTVCRRQAGLEIGLSLTPRDGPCHVVIDTTGLKVFGAGGWYVRKHGMGRGRRRTWRKLHLGVDETTKEIVAVDLTTSGVHDGPHFPALLEQVVGTVGQVSGDRVYDSGTCYEAILARHATPTIPPRRNARPSRAKDLPPHRQVRDAVLRHIKSEGRYARRTESGATRQSLADDCMDAGGTSPWMDELGRSRMPEPRAMQEQLPRTRCLGSRHSSASS